MLFRTALLLSFFSLIVYCQEAQERYFSRGEQPYEKVDNFEPPKYVDFSELEIENLETLSRATRNNVKFLLRSLEPLFTTRNTSMVRKMFTEEVEVIWSAKIEDREDIKDFVVNRSALTSFNLIDAIVRMNKKTKEIHINGHYVANNKLTRAMSLTLDKENGVYKIKTSYLAYS